MTVAQYRLPPDGGMIGGVRSVIHKRLVTVIIRSGNRGGGNLIRDQGVPMSGDHRHTQTVTWTRLSQAVVLFLQGRTATTGAPVAAVVGTVLSVVNQGDVLLGGGGGIGTWIRVAVNYLVPFCVASIGFLSARRVRPPDPPDPSFIADRSR